MRVEELKTRIHPKLYEVISNMGFDVLRPSQAKSIKAGLFEGKSLLVCTPTGSGKTLVAELARMHSIIGRRGKAIYIVPLKSLATEKHKDFQKKYGTLCRIAMTIGDLDEDDPKLAGYDLIIATSEKLDSLIRRKSPWLADIATVVVDEIHLLNDNSRGPTLEIVITLLRSMLSGIQIIGLSATIGNPQELAAWLDAALVQDEWRPVELHKGVYHDGVVEFP